MERFKINTQIKLIISVILIQFVITVSSAQVVIVVNIDNPINDITVLELKRMYMGDKTYFPNGERVLLAQHEDLLDTFNNNILGLTKLQFKKHWMSLIFSGKNSIAPKMFNNVKKLNDFVLDNKGAIAILNFADVDKSYKIITIDGYKPGNTNYPFK